VEAQEFIDLLESPERAKEKGIDELKKLAHAHPYSQPAQLLYAIRLRKSSEHLFHQQLGKASILTNDRSVLFDLFEQEEDDFDMMPAQLEEDTFELPREKTQWNARLEEETSEEEESDTLPVEEEVIAPMKVYNSEEEEDESEGGREGEGERESEGEDEREEDVERDDHAAAAPVERKEKDLSSLPADERVRAILERNRQLREDFERKKQKGEAPLSDMDERLNKIKERLSALKRTPEETETQRETAEENTVFAAETEEATKDVEVKQDTPSTEEYTSTEETLSPEEKETPAIVTEEPVFQEVNEPHFTADADEEEPEEVAEPEEKTAEEVYTDAEAEEEEDYFAPNFDETYIDSPSMSTDEEDPEPEPLEHIAFEVEGESESEGEGEGEGEGESEGEEEERSAFVLPSSESEAVAKESSSTLAPDEHMSFSEWLKHLNKQGGSGVEGVEASKQTPAPAADSFENKVQLLDSFVEKLPSLKKKVAPGPKTTPIEIGHLVNQGNDSLVTETLAKVYIEQKHYDKAIKAYQILKLKYPEKSSFFASQISEIKKLKDLK
jgi:hypothetical protein